MTGFAKVMLRTGLAALALGMAGSAQAAVLYDVIDLGTFGGTTSFGYAINNAGQVAGFAALSSGAQRAFLYSGGVKNNLGTLSGGITSAGYDINNAGQVTGSSTINGDVFAPRAFRYSDGVMSNLGTLGGTSSVGWGINNVGQVTGQSKATNGAERAFLYSNGVMSNLGTLGGNSSIGNAINDIGQVVGTSALSNGQNRSFLYSGGVMSNLGTLGGSFSTGEDINNAGQMTGLATIAGTGNNQRAYLYSDGVMTNLGLLSGSVSSQGRAINNLGEVVGNVTVSGGDLNAFIYSDGVMSNLNGLITSDVWDLEIASDINDAGQITGRGRIAGGPPRAFLLNPVSGSSSGNPLLPSAIDPSTGAFQFEFTARPNRTVWIDPLVATGYDYVVSSGQNILSASFLNLGDADGYQIYSLVGGTLGTLLGMVLGGETYNFGPVGVSGFALRDIEAALMLDPANQTAFVTGLTFNVTGPTTIAMSQTPVTTFVGNGAVPEPASWAMMIIGFGLVGGAMRSKRRRLVRQLESA
jgi:probable HAF family extracellular repeat protein